MLPHFPQQPYVAVLIYTEFEKNVAILIPSDQRNFTKIHPLAGHERTSTLL